MQIDRTSYTSPNHGPRDRAVSALVLHHGAGSKAGDLDRLTDPKSKVSAHYYVDRAGRIYQLVSDTRVAWHAGVSFLEGQPRVNDYSLGIETEHIPGQTWPQVQLDSIAWLCRLKMTEYSIPPSRVVSHRAIAPDRKVDPSDFPLGPEPAFRSWVAALAFPARSDLPLHGCILTHAATLDSLEAKIMAGQHTTLKVVTSWGLGSGWSLDTRARACALTGYTIVRTQAGDPSSGTFFPHYENVLSEIGPWYAIRRHNLFIEIGNEPNSDPTITPAGYAWQLDKAITACRKAFPLARLIAPALVLDRGKPETWLASPEFAAASARCDLLGVHAYAYRAFDDAGQFATITRLYASFPRPLALTEYGINDASISDRIKGSAYAEMVQRLPARYEIATYYHANDSAMLSANDAAYALDLSGDTAYGEAL